MKNPANAGLQIFWRRARDSNPRTYDSQQFSRLPHSTTLPALRRKSTNSDQFCKIGIAFFREK